MVRYEVRPTRSTVTIGRANPIAIWPGGRYVAYVGGEAPQTKLFLNGAQVGSSPTTIPPITSNTLSMRIGAMHFNEAFSPSSNDRFAGLAAFCRLDERLKHVR